MSENKLHKDGIGVVLELEVINTLTDTAYDLTGNTELSIILKKPSGTVLIKTATAATPTNGKMQYTTVADDLDEAGWWEIQGRVQGPSTIDFYTETKELRVFENL